MAFWLVKYGNTQRFGEGDNEETACKDAYGLYHPERMTLLRLPKSPRYIARKQLLELVDEVIRQHNKRVKS